MITAADTVRASLDREAQLRLIEQIKEVQSISPFRSLRTPGGKPMSVKVTAAGKLGWTSDEKGYRYVDSDPDGKPWPHIPDEWIEIADRVAGPHPWDSAIVNWYRSDATLGPHQDLSEFDTSYPVVTISLGDSAVWSVRPEREITASTCVLRSGDVVVLDGVARLCFHSVTKVIAEPLLSPLGAKRGRLSISVRVAGEVAA